MKIKSVTKLLVLLALSCFLFACGGGGGDTPAIIDTSTTLKGVVAAGIFQTGTVDIHAVKSDGTLDAAPLKSVNIVATNNGEFAANIGTYTGSIVALAYGTYVDEATGATITLPKASPLRAALPASSIKAGDVKLNITALTTVAVAQAGPAATFTSDSISKANSTVATAFNITNITDVAPVAPADLSKTAVTVDQKQYTALLAVLSQYAAKLSATPAAPTAADVISALSNMASAINASSAFNVSTALALQTAAADLTARTGNTVVDAIKATTAAANYVNSVKDGSLLNGGTAITIFPLKLRTVGTGDIGSIHTAITLPEGVVIFPSSTTGITKSGVAASAYLESKTTGLTTVISLAKADGLAAGEFMTIYCGYPAGKSPVLADIVVSETKVTDVKGNDVTSSFAIEKF